jgi:hypothetical protein
MAAVYVFVLCVSMCMSMCKCMCVCLMAAVLLFLYLYVCVLACVSSCVCADCCVCPRLRLSSPLLSSPLLSVFHHCSCTALALLSRRYVVRVNRHHKVVAQRMQLPVCQMEQEVCPGPASAPHPTPPTPLVMSSLGLCACQLP